MEKANNGQGGSTFQGPIMNEVSTPNQATDNNTFNNTTNMGQPDGTPAGDWPNNPQIQNNTFGPQPVQPFNNGYQAAPAPKRTSKAVIVCAIVIPIVVILGILGTAVVVLIFGVGSYAETFTAFDEFDKKMAEIANGNSCSQMTSKIGSETVSGTTYEGYISSCADDIVAAIEAAGQFAKTYGAKHNPEIKAGLEAYKNTLDTFYTDERGLRARMNNFGAWHEFMKIISEVGAGNFFENPDENRTALSRALDIIRETNVPAAVAFADECETRFDDLYQAAVAYAANPSFSGYDMLQTAYTTFDNYIDALDEVSVYGIDIAKIDELQVKMNDLRDIMNTVYAEEEGTAFEKYSESQSMT